MHDTTRLAPSPTGALHLGNARTFLITWAIARRHSWRIVYRVEDLDTPRVKPGALDGIARTLAWLGLDWDEPIVGPRENPLVQSRDVEVYRDAMRILAGRGLAYPSALSRAEIEAAASAPQEGAHDIAFPASLRPANAGTPMDFDRVCSDALAQNGEQPNWRFLTPALPDCMVRVEDRVAGDRQFDVSAIVGDFVLWTKRGLPSYQLAVVVDDHRQGVSQVIRGDDLLDSAARQLLLHRALGLSPEPKYWHVPLVIGEDGKRLAKRHGDTRVDSYRTMGVPAEAIIGLIAHWSIPEWPRKAMSAAEFRNRFDPDTLSKRPIVFSSADDAWLAAQARR